MTANGLSTPPPQPPSRPLLVGDTAPAIPGLVPATPYSVVSFLHQTGGAYAEAAVRYLRERCRSHPRVSFLIVTHGDRTHEERWLEGIGGLGGLIWHHDPVSETYTAWGLANPKRRKILSFPGTLLPKAAISHPEIPIPHRWQSGTFLVDRNRTVLWKQIDENSDQLPDLDRAPVLREVAEEVRAESATRTRLDRVFSDFYDSLFNAAFAAGDSQQQHCLDVLHEVKARQAEIIAGILDDVAVRPAESRPDATPLLPIRSATRPTPPARLASRLQDAFTRRCRTLSLEPQEGLLLASAFERHMLEEETKQARPPGGGTREVAQPTAEPKPARPPQTGSGDDKVARIVSRFRDAGLKILLYETPASVSGEPAPGAPAPETRRQLPKRRLIGATLIALSMLCLMLLWDEAETPAAPPDQQQQAAGSPRDAASPPDKLLGTQVPYLLRRGDAALAALRLSEPFPDSAAANYLAVLAIDPLNSSAGRGLEQIVARYAELARGALLRGDVAQAKLMLERARTVLPQAAAVQQLEHDIAATCTMRVPPCTPNFL